MATENYSPQGSDTPSHTFDWQHYGDIKREMKRVTDDTLYRVLEIYPNGQQVEHIFVGSHIKAAYEKIFNRQSHAYALYEWTHTNPLFLYTGPIRTVVEQILQSNTTIH